MRYIDHVMTTWFLAQLIRVPLSIISDMNDGSFMQFDVQLQFAFMALLFSAPAMLLCLIIIKPLRMLPFDKWVNLLLRASLAAACVLVTLFMIVVALGAAAFFEEVLSLILPGCGAAFIASIIRYKQFFNLKQDHADEAKNNH